MPRARSLAPFLTSQRGLSGTKNMLTKNSSDGTAVRANIHRQPAWPYQDVRMNSSLAPAGSSRTINQLMNCAARMPMTMVSWLIATRRPRAAAGAISAMYMGERFDARPIATPPSMRQATKIPKLVAIALPSDVTTNRAAEKISRRFRPN